MSGSPSSTLGLAVALRVLVLPKQRVVLSRLEDNILASQWLITDARRPLWPDGHLPEQLWPNSAWQPVKSDLRMLASQMVGALGGSKEP